MIDITFKFVEDELVKAYVSHPKEKKRTNLFVILGCVFLFIGILGFKFDDGGDGIVLHFILTIAGVYYIFTKFRRKITYRKLSNSNISLLEDISYTFSDNSFKNEGKSYKNEIDWRIIHGVIENTDYFYIYISEGIMHIIPKRAFTSEKLQAFKEILQSQKDLKKMLID